MINPFATYQTEIDFDQKIIVGQSENMNKKVLCFGEKFSVKRLADFISTIDKSIIYRSEKPVPSYYIGYNEKTGVKVEVKIKKQIENNYFEASISPCERMRIGNKIYIPSENDDSVCICEVDEASDVDTDKFVFFYHDDAITSYGNYQLPDYVSSRVYNTTLFHNQYYSDASTFDIDCDSLIVDDVFLKRCELYDVPTIDISKFKESIVNETISVGCNVWNETESNSLLCAIPVEGTEHCLGELMDEAAIDKMYAEVKAERLKTGIFGDLLYVGKVIK